MARKIFRETEGEIDAERYRENAREREKEREREREEERDTGRGRERGREKEIEKDIEIDRYHVESHHLLYHKSPLVSLLLSSYSIESTCIQCIYLLTPLTSPFLD